MKNVIIANREDADATHEAAHAIVADRCGFRVTSVNLFPKGLTRGECHFVTPHHDPAADIAVSLAGAVGEILAGYEYRPLLSLGADFKAAEARMREIAGPDAGEETRVAIIDEGVRTARKHLTDYWQAVLVIARMLIRDGSVSGRVVRKTIQLHPPATCAA